MNAAVTGTRARTYAAAPSAQVPAERLDVLLHALAQLPDGVTLTLDDAGPERPRLELLADAYAIQDRVSFSPAGSASPCPALVDRGGRPRPLADVIAEMGDGLDLQAAVKRDAAVLRGQRIAVLTNLPTHYRVPLFNRIARRLDAAGATFRVLFLAAGDPERPWMHPGTLEFQHDVVRTRRLGRRRFVPIDLERRLGAFAPTLVLAGGFSPLAAGRAARFCSREGVPFGVWSGDIATRPTARSRIRHAQRRRLMARATFAVAYGFAAGEYLRGLAPEVPFVYGRNTAPIPSPSTRTDDGTVNVLTVGRAVKGKALESVVEALALLPRLPCRLTVVGDGPRLPELVRRAGGDARIHFVGAVDSMEVNEHYRVADVFAFPSRFDVFGLVLVEAMGAGVAPVVSAAAGAVDDLGVDGETCLLVEGDDAASWAAALRRLVEEPTLRRRIGTAAARAVHGRWTLDHAAEAMIAGFRLGVLAGRERDG